MEIAQANGIDVIEDAAQALGAKYDGVGAGAIGRTGCFSFYPTKNLGGFGDGGLITTNDDELAEKIRLFTNHGMKPRYYHSEVGANSRLDAVQAAVLSIKIKQARTMNSKTRNVLSIVSAQISPQCRHRQLAAVSYLESQSNSR